jgi:putative methionine-R-sulfoxide reductase with GAF domain
MKVFVSSTYVDLIEHRAGVHDAVAHLGHQPGAMEVFGAQPDEPLVACLREIDACDVFVGIYAHRYGFVPESSQFSVTELEYEHASMRGMPRFCFLVDEDHPWPPKFIEDGESRTKLAAFKARVQKDLTTDTFTTKDALAYKVTSALGRFLTSSGFLTGPTPPVAVQRRLERANDLVELLELCLLDVEDVTRTDYNQIFLLTTGAYERRLIAVADAMPEHKQRYRVATFAGLIGSVAASSRSLNSSRVRERPGYFQAVLETRSELVVPVVRGASLIGVINSECEVEDHFDAQQMRGLEDIALALATLLPTYGWAPTWPLNEIPWVKRSARYKEPLSGQSLV